LSIKETHPGNRLDERQFAFTIRKATRSPTVPKSKRGRPKARQLPCPRPARSWHVTRRTRWFAGQWQEPFPDQSTYPAHRLQPRCASYGTFRNVPLGNDFRVGVMSAEPRSLRRELSGSFYLPIRHL